MGDPKTTGLTDRQAKWFASVESGIARDTGRSLEEWVELARACPVEAPRARLRWMKDTYGIGQNRASVIFNAAFGSAGDWRKPVGPAHALWSAPGDQAIFDAFLARVRLLPDIVEGQRKSFVAFSRSVQFAAVRPERSGGVALGLAVLPDTDPRLLPAKRESWSERLKSRVVLTDAASVDDGIEALLRVAWEAAG